jgi:hypothetical protein
MKRILLLLSILLVFSIQIYSQATQGTRVTAPIMPNDSGDVYATHDAYFGKGGYRAVTNLTARDNINYNRRSNGMLVYVITDSTIYQLKNGIDNNHWFKLSLGNSGDTTVYTKNNIAITTAGYTYTFRSSGINTNYSVFINTYNSQGNPVDCRFTKQNNSVAVLPAVNCSLDIAVILNSGGGSFDETDPIFSASVAKSIKSTDTARWARELLNGILRWNGSSPQPYSAITDTSLIFVRTETISTQHSLGCLTLNGQFQAGSSHTSNNGNAITGQSYSNTGVFGISATSSGLQGQSTSSYGVFGSSSTGRGVYGTSTSNDGVWGASGSGVGVRGTSNTGVSALFNNAIGNTSDIVQAQINGSNKFKINKDGRAFTLADTLPTFPEVRTYVSIHSEPALGNPSVSGYLPSKSTSGVVTWIAPSTNMTYPGGGAGLAYYNGSSAWGTSLTVGTAANNIVQLNSSSQLPAVSGVNLTGLTKSQVNLSLADNTSDASKPISTATQTALDLKFNKADTISSDSLLHNAHLTGIPTAPTAAENTNTTQLATAAFVATASNPSVVKALRALGSDYKAMSLGLGQPCASTYTLVDGTIYFTKVYLDSAMVIHGIRVVSSTRGVFVADSVSAFNGVAIYTVSGTSKTLAASSANSSMIWRQAAGTPVSVALSSNYSASKGIIEVALLYNSASQTTAPVIQCGNNGWENSFGAFGIGSGHRLQCTLAAQATMPTPVSNYSTASLGSIVFITIY